MRRVVALVVMFTLAGRVAYAHVTVSPTQSKPGVTQNYELRVHNEGKLTTTALDLEIPEGISVLEVAKPASGTFVTIKAGDRVTTVMWKVDVPSNTYVALKFTARNPERAGELRWNVRQHLADGSVVDWSDKPGAKQKAAVTKVAAPAPEAPARTGGPTGSGESRRPAVETRHCGLYVLSASAFAQHDGHHMHGSEHGERRKLIR